MGLAQIFKTSSVLVLCPPAKRRLEIHKIVSKWCSSSCPSRVVGVLPSVKVKVVDDRGLSLVGEGSKLLV
jgi:hypothetical protein